VETLQVDKQLIDRLFANDATLTTDDLGIEPEPHRGLILKNNTDSSALVMIQSDLSLKPIKQKVRIDNILPKAAEQTIYMIQLLNSNLPLVMATGPAGTGKTLLSIAAGMHIVLNSEAKQTKLILCKNLSEVGNHRIGAVPGGLREKIDPYLACYKDALDYYLGDRPRGMLDALEAQEIIEYRPVNILRGASIRNAIVIVDEAQNIAKADMRTICTRIGEDSRMFLLGDIRQSDESHGGSGMKALLDSHLIRESSLVAHSNLLINHRSELSKLLDKALE